MAINNATNTSLTGQSGTGNFAGTINPIFIGPTLGTPESGNGVNLVGVGRLVRVLTLTSGTSATYTVPAGVTYLLVEMVGGGGGGGGGGGSSTGVSAGAGGGGAGYVRRFINPVAASYTYTIGAGGAGAAAGANNGAAGGTTLFSFGSMEARGGGGGAPCLTPAATASPSTSFSRGGYAGMSLNGHFSSYGAPGAPGIASIANYCGGHGGASFLGGGGAGTCNITGFGAGSSSFGAGGGGAASTTVAQGGGAGGGGLIVIYEFA